MIDEKIRELEEALRKLEDMDPFDPAIPELIKQVQHTNDRLLLEIENDVSSAIKEAVQILVSIDTYSSREAIYRLIDTFPEHEVAIRTIANI